MGTIVCFEFGALQGSKLSSSSEEEEWDNFRTDFVFLSPYEEVLLLLVLNCCWNFCELPVCAFIDLL